MPVTKEDARRVADREEFVDLLRKTPLSVIRATLKAVRVAPGLTAAAVHEARRKVAYDALSEWEEPKRSELVNLIVPLAALLATSNTHKEARQENAAGSA